MDSQASSSPGALRARVSGTIGILRETADALAEVETALWSDTLEHVAPSQQMLDQVSEAARQLAELYGPLSQLRRE
jgi:hypothetical protein